MTTINKRTMVNLPPDIKIALDALAEKRQKSVSKTAAELLEFALNIQEDFYLGEMATERMSKKFKTLSHGNVWE